MKQTTRWAALHYRDFRLLWGSQFLSIVGSQMTFTAVNWHVFNLLKGETRVVLGVSLDTGALGLGLLGLVRILPILFFALIGGAMANSHDRRKVMTVTQSTSAVCSFVLAGLALTGHDSLYAIYALTAAIAAAGAFDNPSRFSSARTMLPIVASDILKTSVEGYGLLATAQSAGAVLAGTVVSLHNWVNLKRG